MGKMSPYMVGFSKFDQSIRNIHFNQETRECAFLVTNTSVYQLNDSNFQRSTFVVSNLLQTYYKVTKLGSVYFFIFRTINICAQL